MKPYYLYNLILFFALVFFIAGCNNNDNINPNQKGDLTLHFDNIVGDENLVLSTGTYINSSNESFSVTTLKYYISNIKFKKTDNSEYTIPQNDSYFLVNESDEESLEVVLHDIPSGDYDEVSFILGVDSAKSVANASEKTGVLNTENSDMYRDMNSGYIFFKIEGSSPAAPDNQFEYSIGGYGGASAETRTINNLKTIKFSFGSAKATVRNNIAPEVHLYVDVLKVFAGDHTISIAEHPTILFTDYATNVADNYSNMIEVGHVHNDPMARQ